MRQLKPRKPLACSPGETGGHWSRGPPLPSLPSARHTFHAKGPRAWPGGRRGDPAGGAHKTPRLRGASRPRAVLRGLHPSRLLRAARGKRRPTEGSAQPAGLTGLGQSLRPLSAAARHRGRGPGSRHGAGHATATDASARPAAQPPRRPAAAAELSPPLCSAPPSPPPPPRPALPPEPPPSRRPAPLGPQPATGAGGGGDAGRRLLLPAISSLLPGSPRWLGAEGSGLEGRHVGGGFHHRKCLSARRGETWRGGRGVARRLEAWTAARTRSLARSLTASPQPVGGEGPAGLQRTPGGGKLTFPTKRCFTRCGRGGRPGSQPPRSSLCALECFPARGRAGQAGPGPSRARGALAAGAGLARPALPPRPEAGGARRARSYLPSTCLRRLSAKSVSAYSEGSTHELHINTHVQATYVQARWSRAPRHEGSIVRILPSPVGCDAARGVDPLHALLGS